MLVSQIGGIVVSDAVDCFGKYESENETVLFFRSGAQASLVHNIQTSRDMVPFKRGRQYLT